MTDDSAITEKVWSKPEWQHQKLVIALKNLEEKLFVDVRKWIPLGREDEGQFRPTSKGLMLEVRDWRAVVKEIESFLEEIA